VVGAWVVGAWLEDKQWVISFAQASGTVQVDLFWVLLTFCEKKTLFFEIEIDFGQV